MSDILYKIDDLIAQATEERSHYYTANTLREAKAEIERMRVDLEKKTAWIKGCGERCSIYQECDDLRSKLEQVKEWKVKWTIRDTKQRNELDKILGE